MSYRTRDGATMDVTSLRGAGLRRYHREVRLVFQDPFSSLNPRMTVRNMIGEPLLLGGLRGRVLTERVAHLMELVGLDPRTIERYPRAVVADEATAALDAFIRAQVLDLLLDLQARLGLSFVSISHDISVVRYVCHRVAVMHRGRIVEIGEAAHVCSAPSEPYTQALLSAVPNSDPRAKRMLFRQRFAPA